jgi:hypothetical protein
MWPIVFRRKLPVIVLLVIAPVRMLDLRSLEFDRVRIAVWRQPVDDRSSGIAESEKLRDFVERLAGGVVTSVADVTVGPKIFLQLREKKMRVSA